MTSSRNETDQRRPGKWYVIRTQPQADHIAAQELDQAGYEIFAPRIKDANSKLGDYYKPLFPGYIFLHWDMETKGRPSFQGVPHIAGWVSFNGELPSVPDEAVTELANRVRDINYNGGLWRRFKPGERVRIVSKAIESLAEVVEEARSPQSRVKVLFQFMGGLVSAKVPYRTLQPVAGEKENPPLQRRTRGRGRWIRGFDPQLDGTS